MNESGSGTLHVALSGASGLVGSSLARVLTQRGHRMSRLVRRAPLPSTDEIQFGSEQGRLEPSEMEGVDAVVHLAGENVAAGRWTAERKRRIRDSRVLGTRLVAETLSKMQRPPRVLVNASAIGFYGDRGDEQLTESSEPGEGFLPQVCLAWEAATAAAERSGVRVVKLRIGVVLSTAGGALAKMLPTFKLGLGGRIGDGRQYVSWVTLHDLVRIILFSLGSDELEGPVNAVGPHPVRNDEFTRVLARVLHRPALVPLPASFVRTAFGEMGRELLLASTRVLPRRLEQAGFAFEHETLHDALRFELAKQAR